MTSAWQRCQTPPLEARIRVTLSSAYDRGFAANQLFADDDALIVRVELKEVLNELLVFG